MNDCQSVRFYRTVRISESISLIESIFCPYYLLNLMVRNMMIKDYERFFVMDLKKLT